MKKELPLSPKTFHSIYTRVPRLCVEVVIRTGRGVLLAKRAIPPAKGYWHIPGGTVHFDETLPEAVQRVAKRELGIRVVVQRVLGVLDYTPHKESFGHAVGVAFLCRIVSGTIKKNEESTELAFFRTVPRPIIREQRRFLNNLFKKKSTLFTPMTHTDDSS